MEEEEEEEERKEAGTARDGTEEPKCFLPPPSATFNIPSSYFPPSFFSLCAVAQAAKSGAHPTAASATHQGCCASVRQGRTEEEEDLLRKSLPPPSFLVPTTGGGGGGEPTFPLSEREKRKRGEKLEHGRKEEGEKRKESQSVSPCARTEYKAAGVKRAAHGRRRRAPLLRFLGGGGGGVVGGHAGRRGRTYTYKHGRVREPTQY